MGLRICFGFRISDFGFPRSIRFCLALGLLAAGLILTELSLAQSSSRPGSGPPKGGAAADKGGGEEGPAQVPSDVQLVEKLIAARKEYQTTLEKLRLHYMTNNDMERARWAEDELRHYHRMMKYSFRLDVGDVPAKHLQPKHNMPEANKLFREAMQYKGKGFGSDYLDNQRRAELLLQQLLDKYPECDKIGEAAYQLGDLYENYRPTPQYRRAAAYFERSFQWNKTSQSDARLRAARIYDRSLAERSRAVELYRDVIAHDTDESRLQEAQRRINELTGRR